MIAAVKEHGAEVYHRVAGQHANLHRFLDSALHRRNILFRNPSASNLALEQEAGSGGQRLEPHLDVRVLSVAAGLAHEPGYHLRASADGLPVRHLGHADVGLDAPLAEQPRREHLQVKLSHAGHDRLPGLVIDPHLERRVLVGELAERRAKAVGILFRLRLDGDRHHRLGKHHRLQNDRLILTAQRVAGGGPAQSDGGDDLAGTRRRDLFAAVGVHAQQPGHPLAPVGGGVVQVGAGLQYAGVDAKVGQPADVRIGHHLERQCRQALVVARRALDVVARARHDAGDRRFLRRRRQIVHHAVEQQLDALVLERTAAQYREQLAGHGVPAQRRAHLAVVDRVARQVALHQLVIEIGEPLHQFGSCLPGALAPRGGNLLGAVGGAEVDLFPGDPAHLHQVDDAVEVRAAAGGQLYRDGVGAELGVQLVHALGEVGAHAVHLVDEYQPRHRVGVGLFPHRFALRLHAGDRAEHRHRAVEHAQRALHLHGEVHVPRGVDDVDRVVAPDAVGGGRRDRDAALLFEIHPVHFGLTVMDFTKLVLAAGVVQDALGGGGLAGVNVSHDPDVAGMTQPGAGLHCSALVPLPVLVPAATRDRYQR